MLAQSLANSSSISSCAIIDDSTWASALYWESQRPKLPLVNGSVEVVIGIPK